MKENEIKELTRAEEEVMQVLWKLGPSFVKDLLEEFKPQPAYNTVSTIIRILERKGFVSHKSFGKTHQYYPKITRETYSTFKINTLTKGYFNGSFKRLVSFMTEENNLGLKEIEEIRKQLLNKENNE